MKTVSNLVLGGGHRLNFLWKVGNGKLAISHECSARLLLAFGTTAYRVNVAVEVLFVVVVVEVVVVVVILWQQW